MTGLLQILDLELVLVQIGLSFSELVDLLFLARFLLFDILLKLLDLGTFSLQALFCYLVFKLVLFFLLSCDLLASGVLLQFQLFVLDFLSLYFIFVVVIELGVFNFLLVSLLLILQLLLVVLSQFSGKFFTLLVLDKDLTEIDFEFLEQAIDGRLVLSLDLLDLFLIALLHFKTFLLELQITVTLLLQLLLEQSLDLLDLFVVILLDLTHSFTVLSLL